MHVGSKIRKFAETKFINVEEIHEEIVMKVEIVIEKLILSINRLPNVLMLQLILQTLSLPFSSLHVEHLGHSIEFSDTSNMVV